LLAGCARGPRTPEQAFQKLERAIAAGDAVGFYQLLDQPTRSAIASTLRDQRLQRTIISAKYPEAEAQKALATLAAAEETDAAQYFRRIDGDRHVVEAFRKRLGSVSGPIKSKIDGAKGPSAAGEAPAGEGRAAADPRSPNERSGYSDVWVARQDGMPFRFHKNWDGSWGFTELRGDWELERDRAHHAVKTVQDNAKLYQKAEAQ
jgi:hypothetical protein